MTTLPAPKTFHGITTPGEKEAAQNRIGMGGFFGSSDASEVYSSAERLTGPVATPLLKHAGLTRGILAPISVLDLACGTGVVSAHLRQLVKEQDAEDMVQLTCADLSESQVSYVSQRIEENRWPNTRAMLVDAMKSILPSDHFDFVLIGMALILIPDPRSTVKECFRMLKPRGTFAVSTWLTEGWVPDTRDAVLSLPGSLPWPKDSDELMATWALGPWHNRHFVESTLLAAGYVDVKTEVVTRHITINSADDFCHVLRGFVRVVTDVYWTQQQRDACLHLVAPALKKYLDGKYGAGKPFTVERTAIMASGRKPEC